MLRNRPKLMSISANSFARELIPLGTSNTPEVFCIPCKPLYCHECSDSPMTRWCTRSALHSPTKGEGVSSTTFWCRRWMEHSRSGSVTMVPLPSPKICTSMCRARCTYFSTNTPESPKLALPCLQ